VEGEHVVCSDSEIDPGEIPEAVNGEARTGQQGECKREFSDDQSAAQFVAGGTVRGAAAGFQCLGRVKLRGIPGGRAAKQQAAERGGGQGYQQDGEIEREIRF